MVDRYAVIGNPVDHSQSPFIHNEYAQATHQEMSYSRLFAEVGQFTQIIQEFIKTGGKGLNVTLPFKKNAYCFADELTERAQAAKAVNTLTFRDGKAYGDNTDGVGLIQDIVGNLDFAIQGQHVLLLGAGGAVRGVLKPILEQKPASVTLANRTLLRAKTLAYHSSQWGPVTAVEYQALKGRRFDIIINGTSTSLHNALPPIPHGIFSTRTMAYDMVYSKGLTPFLQRAQMEHAGILADGIGMLAEQAAESFRIWRGIQPDTRVVINQLRKILA